MDNMPSKTTVVRDSSIPTSRPNYGYNIIWWLASIFLTSGVFYSMPFGVLFISGPLEILSIFVGRFGPYIGGVLSIALFTWPVLAWPLPFKKTRKYLLFTAVIIEVVTIIGTAIFFLGCNNPGCIALPLWPILLLPILLIYFLFGLLVVKLRSRLVAPKIVLILIIILGLSATLWGASRTSRLESEMGTFLLTPLPSDGYYIAERYWEDFLITSQFNKVTGKTKQISQVNTILDQAMKLANAIDTTSKSEWLEECKKLPMTVSKDAGSLQESDGVKCLALGGAMYGSIDFCTQIPRDIVISVSDNDSKTTKQTNRAIRDQCITVVAVKRGDVNICSQDSIPEYCQEVFAVAQKFRK